MRGPVHDRRRLVELDRALVTLEVLLYGSADLARRLHARLQRHRGVQWLAVRLGLRLVEGVGELALLLLLPFEQGADLFDVVHLTLGGLGAGQVGVLHRTINRILLRLVHSIRPVACTRQGRARRQLRARSLFLAISAIGPHGLHGRLLDRASLVVKPISSHQIHLGVSVLLEHLVVGARGLWIEGADVWLKEKINEMKLV